MVRYASQRGHPYPPLPRYKGYVFMPGSYSLIGDLGEYLDSHNTDTVLRDGPPPVGSPKTAAIALPAIHLSRH
jgi:hypothetical protein